VMRLRAGAQARASHRIVRKPNCGVMRVNAISWTFDPIHLINTASAPGSRPF